MAGRAIPLGLLALVVAACGFDPAGGRSRGGGGDGDSDAKDPDAAPGAVPDADPGAPDGSPGGSPDADPEVEVLIDTLAIPATGEEIESVLLVAGVTYRLIASGVVGVSNGGGGWSADAEYFWRDSAPNSVFDGQGGPQPVDIGVSLDDPTIDGSKLPDWGAPTVDHTYQLLVVGDNQTITARFHDGNYDNNTGSITLEIWQTAL